MRFISIFVLIILANQLAYTQNQLEIDDLTGGLNTITTAVPFLMITQIQDLVQWEMLGLLLLQMLAQ